MGTAPLVVTSDSMPVVPRFSWRAKEYWVDAKARLEKYVTRRVLRPGRCLDVVLRMYSSLGGHADANSPVFVKGGAAAWLYLSQQCSIWRDLLPAAFTRLAPAADLDFGATMPADKVVPEAARALTWLSDLASDVELVEKFEKQWPKWCVRRDAQFGESFGGGIRRSIGNVEKEGAKLAMKVTCHGGCVDRHSGQNFSLVRLGLAVWNRQLRRASVANLVDISVGTREPTTVVMGMRVQTPRSMLRTLRRMAFAEVDYEPWLSAHCDGDKQHRRLERIIKLSFIEDFKTMGGRVRGWEAAVGLMRRWQRVPELLLTDCVELSKAAEAAPPQLRHFYLVCARVCAVALSSGKMREYDTWIGNVVFPQIADLAM